jgi:hypothetical protein
MPPLVVPVLLIGAFLLSFKIRDESFVVANRAFVFLHSNDLLRRAKTEPSEEMGVALRKSYGGGRALRMIVVYRGRLLSDGSVPHYPRYRHINEACNSEATLLQGQFYLLRVYC